MTVVQDQAVYRAPGGLLLLARVDLVSGRVRFEHPETGAPLYAESTGTGAPAGDLVRLVYQPDADAWRAVPCDLTLADLVLVEPGLVY